MDTSDAFSRIWSAFDAGDILPACAWCGRVRIGEARLLPSPAALAAIDQRYTFSHSICDVGINAYAPAVEDRSAESQLVANASQMATAPDAPRGPGMDVPRAVDAVALRSEGTLR